MNRSAGFVALILVLSIQAASGQEYVWVTGRGLVDIEPLTCTDIATSSFLRRVCYDEANRYLLVRMEEKWLHYCEVDTIVGAFITAPSGLAFTIRISDPGHSIAKKADAKV